MDYEPELASEWSPRNEKGISNYVYTSTMRAYWICPTCQHSYTYPICERQLGDDSCPYCNNRLPMEGMNTLPDLHPELIPEWSVKNELPPAHYLATSSLRAQWHCSTCGNDYFYPICERQLNDDSCPYCNNRLAKLGFNTVVDIKPELMIEWSANNERPASEFMYSSPYWAIWQCPVCHGEYTAPIRRREFHDDACPYCRNVRVLPGFNSFADRHPDLMTQWDGVANIFLVSAKQILDSCNINVWWVCEDNPAHHYQLTPQKLLYYRKRHMKSCPYCKGYRRKRRHFV
ncbi:zinc-ribbon domain-containing protein [Secundilactobacillus pentosiphilus]|uniref:zinc-ribbon domain-containing protein n=1 Tax=Secundilactobacillus pentosiphilus TaxID=1714682 RepID=UPI000B5D02B1